MSHDSLSQSFAFPFTDSLLGIYKKEGAKRDKGGAYIIIKLSCGRNIPVETIRSRLSCCVECHSTSFAQRKKKKNGESEREREMRRERRKEGSKKNEMCDDIFL